MALRAHMLSHRQQTKIGDSANSMASDCDTAREWAVVAVGYSLFSRESLLSAL